MSDNERHCPSVVKNADGYMRCEHGHQMVHKFYLQDARAEISELKEQLAQKDAILGAKLVAVAKDEGVDDNHLGVEQCYDGVKLTLRGKSKIFTPKAISDLIKILKRNYNAAVNYSPPAQVHCTYGIKDES